MLTEFIPFAFKESTPEAAGIDGVAIEAFLRRMNEQKLGLQGYMLYRDGKLAVSSIAAPYRLSDKRHAYSVSKSFTSTAVGIARDEGLLSLEDSVISFFPELLPDKVSENLAAMKIKHLLSMNTGHSSETLDRIIGYESNWAKHFLSLPVENAPGTYFMYNSGATYMLSAIITKLTGMRLYDYLGPRLFNPLGISGVWWEESPDRINDGGWGIHVSQEDMLKLGILYLNRGEWEGKRIVSAEWTDEATAFQSDNDGNRSADWKVGYGYQFWRCRHDCYRADGAFGQYIIVSPEKRTVTVIISETVKTQSVLDAYWETIYASLSDTELPDREEPEIRVGPFIGFPEPSDETIVPFEWNLPENKLGIRSVSVEPAGKALSVKFRGGIERAVELICGSGRWEYNRLSHCPIIPTDLIGKLALDVAAEIAAAWGMDGGKLRVTMQFVSTPHGFVFDFDREERTLAISRTIERGVPPMLLYC